MLTNCKFILKNDEFNYIDNELIDGKLQCNFSHYNYGEGCLSCPLYRQLLEMKNPGSGGMLLEEN